MITDFQRWYKWAIDHMGPIEEEKARKIYNEHYNCDCISCEYRKEHGLMPIHVSNGRCKLPIDATRQLEDECRNL